MIIIWFFYIYGEYSLQREDKYVHYRGVLIILIITFSFFEYNLEYMTKLRYISLVILKLIKEDK